MAIHPLQKPQPSHNFSQCHSTCNSSIFTYSLEQLRVSPPRSQNNVCVPFLTNNGLKLNLSRLHYHPLPHTHTHTRAAGLRCSGLLVYSLITCRQTWLPYSLIRFAFHVSLCLTSIQQQTPTYSDITITHIPFFFSISIADIFPWNPSFHLVPTTINSSVQPSCQIHFQY